MKRIISVLFALVLGMTTTLSLKAQVFGGPDFMRGKMVVGGNVNAGYSTGRLHLGAAPQFGYRLTRSLEVGVRLGYDFYHDYSDPYFGSRYWHFFSGGLYANCEVFRGFYLHVEDEESCVLVRGQTINPSAPRWANSVFVGAGYRQYAFDGSYMYFAFLYNLSWGYYTGNSPYANPFVIRVGYCFCL